MFKRIFSIVFAIISLIFITFIYKIDMLPSNILFPIIIGVFIIGILIILLFLKVNNKIINIVLSIIMSIIMIVIIIISCKLFNTLSFFNSISDLSTMEDRYFILVKKDSKYRNIKELKNKDMGYMHDMDSKVWDKLKVKVNNHEYNNQTELSKDLIDNKIDSIIVNGAYLYVMEEYDEEFINKVRVIYSFKIKKTIEKEKIVNNGDKPFTIYISGIDTSGSISKVSRSDVNILMTVNPKTGRVLLTSIPRDYYVQLHNTTGYKDKLTHAGIYGVDMSMDTIEDLLNVDINYYIRINFDTLVKLVDEIGGIDINSDTSFNKRGCNVRYGINHFDGKCALVYSRERKSYSSGDRHRGQNQQQVIEAIINKITTNKEMLVKYDSILNSMKGSFESNFDSTDISKLVKYQINNNIKWNVNSISLNGYDSSNYTYSYYGSKLYVMEPDYNTVNSAHDKILEVIGG